MRHLHDVRIPNQEAWVWGWARGGNGMKLGEPQADRWLSPMLHAYSVERGTPPPLDGRNPWNREYWYPWRVAPDALTRACGRVTTTSRRPRFVAGNAGGWDPRFCANCQNTVTGPIRFREVLTREDPWSTQPRHLRSTTPDPVTGM